MNAISYESIAYDSCFLPSVFSIRDVPIIYHPMLFIKAKNSRQLGNKDTAAEIGKLLFLQNED